MDEFKIEEMMSLIESQSSPCISIYLPTRRSGAEVKQNSIRLKNLLNVAREKLIATGIRSVEANKFLTPALDLLHDEALLVHPDEGFVMFLSPGIFRFYRMPIHFREEASLAEKFFITPLLPMITQHGKFFLLTISENQVRFLTGSPFGIASLPVLHMPHDLREAMRFKDPERQLQLHTQTPRIPKARAAAIFHGHGVGIDDEKDDLLEYCQQINQSLHPILRDQTAPLILATVDATVPIYQKANTYPHLINETIPGNPDRMSDAELRRQGWEIAAPYFLENQREAFRTYIRLAGTNLISSDVEKIFAATDQGRLRYLFVNTEERWWGRYDPETHIVISHDHPEQGDEELVNLAVIKAFQNGATVYHFQPVLRGQPSIFAVFRY